MNRKEQIDLLKHDASKQSKIYFADNLQPVSLHEILTEIKSSEHLRHIIEHLRSVQSEDEQQEYKSNNLPYFVLGTFNNSHRKNINLKSSSFLVFDYDHLDDKLDSMKSSLKQDESVYAYFVSPRGNGLKVIYKLEEEVTDHLLFTSVYKHYADKFNVDLGAEPDKTSDAARACFFSYDPELYVNTEAVPLELPEHKKTTGKISGASTGDRTHTATQVIGTFINRGIDEQLAIELMLAWNQQNNPPLPDKKVIDTVNDMYKRYQNEKDLLPVRFKERNNSYIKTIKRGKEFDEVMVTSFKILPKELLVLESSDCLKCDIVSSQGIVYKNVLIENTDWHSRQKFLKALGHQDCVFLGSENDLQALCQFTQLNIPLRKTGTKVIGLHEGIWVIEGINISKDGKAENQSIVPYDKGADAFYHRIKYKELSANEYICMLGTLYDNIADINEKSKVFAYLGWLFATPVKPEVEKIISSFPLLFKHGGQGSGKTSMAKLFARLCGYREPNPNSVTMKTFPLLKMLSSTNAIPQWYDEFKVADMKDYDVDNILRFMRKAYAGEVESKGRADQTVEDYKITAPMVVMGEWNINQPAIMERVILFRSNDIIKKDNSMQRAFRIINELPLEGFMPEYITYCLNQNIPEILSAASEFIKHHFRNIIVAPRIINNLSVMILGLELFRGFAHAKKLIVPEINYPDIIDEQLEEITGAKNGMVRSAVDQLIEELSIMAESSVITPGDYKFIKIGSERSMLAINFKKIFRDFKTHAKRTNFEGDLLDEMSYNKLFDSCEYVHDKNRTVKFGRKSVRCLVIDIDKAREFGISLDGFAGEDDPVTVVTDRLQPFCNQNPLNLN